MTHADAKTAVRHVQRNVQALKDLLFKHIQPPLPSDIYMQLHVVIDDLTDLETHLTERKQATPNCRQLTPDEVQALCAASNVVAFRPAA